MADHHGHDHGPVNYNRAFAIGVALNVTYIVVETVFGLLTGSLALLADAAHNVIDVFALLLAWGAAYLSSLKPSRRYTYGWRSSTILAALTNGTLLLFAVGGIAWEAIDRFRDPEPVTGQTIMWVAGLGVLVNGFTALLFMSGRKHDLNIRGAYLHMAADAAVSLGVLLAGGGILLTGKAWIDPATGLAIAAIILWNTAGLLKEALELSLHAVPQRIDIQHVEEYLRQLPGVTDVYDLHIWAMSTHAAALTVRIVKPVVENEDPLLREIERHLHDRFQIEHATVQIERSVSGSEFGFCPTGKPSQL